jgi:hypothetical protein
MSDHQWNEIERETLDALRSSPHEPTNQERHRLRERLAKSVAVATTSPRIVRLARASGTAPQRRFIGLVLAGLSTPISLAAAFVAGGFTGAFAVVTVQHTGLLEPQVRPRPAATPHPVVVVAPPRLAPSPVTAASEASAPPTLPIESARPATPASPKTVVSARAMARDSSSLSEQRFLLDTARGALQRGDSAGAQEAIVLHEHKYPRSLLVEERETLAIKALTAAGQLSEAESRAARFRARYPQSIMLPAIDHALGHDSVMDLGLSPQ